MKIVNSFSGRLTSYIFVLNIISCLVLFGGASYYLVNELQSRFVSDARANSAMIISMVERESPFGETKLIESLLEEVLRNSHATYAALSSKKKNIVAPSIKSQSHDQSVEDAEFAQGTDKLFHMNFPVSSGESGLLGNLHIDYSEEKTRNEIFYVLVVAASMALFFLLATTALVYVFVKRNIKPMNALSSVAKRITAGEIEESFSVNSDINNFKSLGEDLDAMRLSLVTQRDEIQEREHHVRTIINNMAEGVVTFNQNGLINTANDKARLMFGIKPDENLDKSKVSINDYLYGVDEQGERITGFVINNLKNMLAGVNHELIAVNETQSCFSVGVALMRVNLGYGDIYIANVRDITENKETEKKILHAQQQAERANMAKSEFLSRMSHELRTPMNAIIGFSELLQTDDEHPLNDQQSKDLNRIIVSAKHLLGLINEVLDISQVESGMLELLNENVSVLSIVNESVEMIRPLLERYELSVRLPETKVDYFVYADKMRLKQILINVMSNAAKYNRRNGSISIGIKLCSVTQAEISVSDTGMGISRENIIRMFEPFTRFGPEQTAVEGTGIGLSITKRLLQAMDGSIDVRSKVGVGTTISIKVGLSDIQANSHTQKMSQKKQSGVKVEDQSQHLLLYIEDNPVNLEIVNRILIRIGDYRLLSSPSTELGVALAGTNRPNIVMINLDMPGLNAIVAYRIMRKHPQTMNVPIVAVSSDGSAKQVKMAKSYGFDAYVTSPINAILLEQIIHDLRSGHANDESRFRVING